MSEHDVLQPCRHGALLSPFQHRVLHGDVLTPARGPRPLCAECHLDVEAIAARMAEAHGVPLASWEGTLLRGRVHDIIFSSDIGKYVVCFLPGGVATIAPENVGAFEHDGRRLGERVGEWWQIGYAEDGDIWFHEQIRPSWLLRLAAWASTRRSFVPRRRPRRRRLANAAPAE